MPTFCFTADCGRSRSGGAEGGDFKGFGLPFLLISGDCFESCMLTLSHSFTQLCAGFAASITNLREIYSSWPEHRNSKSSIFWSASNCARRVPLATTWLTHYQS